MRITSLICLLAVFATSVNADNPLNHAKLFLDQNRLVDDAESRSVGGDVIRKRIAASRDPETKLHVFLFALAGRHSAQLDPSQRLQTEKIIADRRAAVNWHDVRNIVRVHAQIQMWNYAASSNATEAAQHLDRWNEWTDLRIAYMFQEFVARERFQRAMWDTFDESQRAKIVSGQWDHLVKKNVGHGRLFSADKQVRRALGPPVDARAFQQKSDSRRQLWEPMLATYRAAAKFERQREFAMDLYDEPFAIEAWHDYAAAFRPFAEAECHSIREIVQAGYADDAKLTEKITQHTSELYSQMLEKYGESSKAFLQHLSPAP
tara:strand:+ start:310451 stop:311407 length:957 start_codon:yes stop_codon:yes gene_type:complete